MDWILLQETIPLQWKRVGHDAEMKRRHNAFESSVVEENRIEETIYGVCHENALILFYAFWKW